MGCVLIGQVDAERPERWRPDPQSDGRSIRKRIAPRSGLPEPGGNEDGLDPLLLQFPRHGQGGRAGYRGSRTAVQLQARNVARVVVPDVERPNGDAACLEPIDVVPRAGVVTEDHLASGSAVERSARRLERGGSCSRIVGRGGECPVVRACECIRGATCNSRRCRDPGCEIGDSGRPVDQGKSLGRRSLAKRLHHQAEQCGCSDAERQKIAQPDQLGRDQKHQASRKQPRAHEEHSSAARQADCAGDHDDARKRQASRRQEAGRRDSP